MIDCRGHCSDIARTAGLVLLLLLGGCGDPTGPGGGAGNGEIIFAARMEAGDTPYELYTVRPDGTGLDRLRRVGPIAGDQLRPSVTADGGTVMFVDDAEMYLIDGDGTDLRHIGLEYLARPPSSPEISPDGSRVAMDDINLFVFDVDDGEGANLTPGRAAQHPTWSPDGDRVAFAASTDGSGRDLYTISPGGGTPRQLTSTPNVREQEPDWHPDGDRILYLEDHGSENLLFTVRADGTNASQVAVGGLRVEAADWSPDGEWIVLQARDTEGGQQLYIVPGSGTDAPIELTGPLGVARAVHPIWTR